MTESWIDTQILISRPKHFPGMQPRPLNSLSIDQVKRSLNLIRSRPTQNLHHTFIPSKDVADKDAHSSKRQMCQVKDFLASCTLIAPQASKERHLRHFEHAKLQVSHHRQRVEGLPHLARKKLLNFLYLSMKFSSCIPSAYSTWSMLAPTKAATRPSAC